jgi:hypothetical protein
MFGFCCPPLPPFSLVFDRPTAGDEGRLIDGSALMINSPYNLKVESPGRSYHKQFAGGRLLAVTYQRKSERLMTVSS